MKFRKPSSPALILVVAELVRVRFSRYRLKSHDFSYKDFNAGRFSPCAILVRMLMPV